MFESLRRRITQSLVLPIFFGILAIFLTIIVMFAWSITFTRYFMLSTKHNSILDLGMPFWFALSFGNFVLVMLIGVLLLLVISYIQQTLYVRKQNTFIDSVTHELKSPLASIRLCLETMEMRELPPPMKQKFTSMMKNDVARLSDLIEHILEAGRLEYKQQELEFDSVHPSTIAKQCIERIKQRHALKPEELELELALHGTDPLLFTSPLALELIMINLLDNAVKYSTRPASITLSLRDFNEKLCIDVSDQGIGLSPRQSKKVFWRFYRIKREDHNARGTGLGLYVVASLAKRLGGRVMAKSEGEGKGSTFSVILPVILSTDESPQSSQEFPA